MTEYKTTTKITDKGIVQINEKTTEKTLSDEIVSHVWIEEMRRSLKRPFKEHFCKGDIRIKDICSECKEEKGLWFFYSEEAVRKFIKQINEDIDNSSGDVKCSVDCIHRIINKRAGDDLIKKQNKSI